MRADKKRTECDEWLLSGFLAQELTPAEEAQVESHLDECLACRRRIGEWAAEPNGWDESSRYLQRDNWDEAAECLSSAGAAGEGNASGPFVVRQIKQWLDASDDPRYLGRFGGYEIVGVVGSGGMGVVLKGFEPSLNRYVAIKALSPALAASGAARTRFAREAEAAAAVLHENVIAIHRVDESHGLPYLVMPYVSGVSLQKRIDDDGPLPLAAILRISRQIAAGLSAAHAQGLVHRDIKPANILLERGVERVTLTDFGLARAADDGSLTKTGFIAGTPQYMSPEQARGGPIDARSDLFSLGSVMYAMCAGHPPFRAESGYAVLRRVTDEQPRRVCEINADMPAWLQDVIDRLHAKNPEERFQTAAEVAELLEQCLAHVQQPSVAPLPQRLRQLDERSEESGRRRRIAMGIGAISALCLLSAAGTIAIVGKRQADLDQGAPSARSGAAAQSDAVSAPAGSISEQWNDGAAEQINRLSGAVEQLQRRAQHDWEDAADGAANNRGGF